MGIRKANLWNLTDGKTRTVIEYIKNIVHPLQNAGNLLEKENLKLKKFERKRRFALRGLTANEMLERINYNNSTR